MFASPRPVRVAAATGHGEWSRRDASDIDGSSREAEGSGSEQVNPRTQAGRLSVGGFDVRCLMFDVKASKTESGRRNDCESLYADAKRIDH